MVLKYHEAIALAKNLASPAAVAESAAALLEAGVVVAAAVIRDWRSCKEKNNMSSFIVLDELKWESSQLPRGRGRG